MKAKRAVSCGPIFDRREGSSASSCQSGLSRSITPCTFLLREIEKQMHSLFFPIEQMYLRLAPCSDAAPFSGQARLAKQCLGNLHDIVAGHVSGRVGPFDIDLVGLSKHSRESAISGTWSNDRFESVTDFRFTFLIFG